MVKNIYAKKRLIINELRKIEKRIFLKCLFIQGLKCTFARAFEKGPIILHFKSTFFEFDCLNFFNLIT
jgi:hypothetical protein